MPDVCQVCKLIHHYQFPNGSDPDGHLATAIGCAGAIMAEMDRAFMVEDAAHQRRIRNDVADAVGRLGKSVDSLRRRLEGST